MDKEVKEKEGGREVRRKRGKEGKEQRKRKEGERERERNCNNQNWRPWSVTGLQFQFWSAFIRMVFHLLFHTFFTSLKNYFALLKKMSIKNNHFLSLSFFLSKNKRVSLHISDCTSVHWLVWNDCHILYSFWFVLHNLFRLLNFWNSLLGFWFFILSQDKRNDLYGWFHFIVVFYMGWWWQPMGMRH